MPDQRSPGQRTPGSLPRAGAVVPGAALGALLYGLLDALRVVLADTLQPSVSRGLVLAGIDGLALAAGGLGLGLVLWLLLRVGRGLGMRLPLQLGVAAGLALAFLLDLGEYWFSAPAPFTEAPPGLGNPLVFAVAALAALGLVAVAGRLKLPGRAVLAVALLALLGVAITGARTVPAGADRPPDDAKNVLLVTLDTARHDYFGAYGRDDVQTPAFDRVAAEGVRLDLAFSQIPVTGPAHTTMFTGMTPWEHGNLLNGLPLDPDWDTLPRQLRQRGWKTAAFVSAYVLDGGLGFERGFNVYDDDFGWLQGWSETVPGRVSAMLQRFTNPDHVLERIGGRTVDAALGWMESEVAGGAPFFVWVHLFDAHGPYEPPPPWDTAYYQGDPTDPAHTSMADAQNIAAYLQPSLRGITDADYVLAQYAGEISYADSQLGRLLDFLDQAGLAQDTLVVVLGDHGESLAGEHGVWFNHGDDLYEASTAIPWAMRLPGGQHAGSVLDQPVELTDLAPTVYELLGQPTPDDVTGQSLLPALQGAPHRGFARGMCFDRPVNQRLRAEGEITKPTYRLVALRTADNRFVDHEHHSGSNEHWAVRSDGPFRIEERAPIAIPEEEALEQLTQAMLESAGVERSQAEQSEDAIRKLQALGYMEE